MSLSRKTRKGGIYEKEIGIFHGTQRKETQKRLKPRNWDLSEKSSPNSPQSLPLWHHAPAHVLFTFPWFFFFYKLVFSPFLGVWQKMVILYLQSSHASSYVTSRIWLTSLNSNFKSWIGRICLTFGGIMCPLLVLYPYGRAVPGK